jgi:hypothetical protein
MPAVEISEMTHRGERRLKLAFAYDAAIIAKVKQLPGRVWSQGEKCWHIPVSTPQQVLEETLRPYDLQYEQAPPFRTGQMPEACPSGGHPLSQPRSPASAAPAE